jgi:ankyrin repeat protein
MDAVEEDKANLIPIFAKAGANVNATDKSGNSALMIAAMLGYADEIEPLLKAGADVNEKDNDGLSAQQLATSPKIASLIWDWRVSHPETSIH